MITMFIGNLLLLTNLTIFANKLLHPKINNMYVIITLILIFSIILSSKSYPFLQEIGTYIMSSCYIIYIFLFYSGKIRTKINTIILFLAFASLSEVFCSNTMNILFNLEQSDLNTYLFLFTLLSSGFLTFIMLHFVAKIVIIITQYNYPKISWLIIILPFSTVVFIFSLSEYFGTFRNNYFVAITFVGLFVANFFTIYIFFKTIKAIELEKEMKQMKMQYDTLNTLYQNNFNFLHDTTRKLYHLNGYLINQNYTELSNQIQDLSAQLLNKYNTINSNSSIISSIINYKFEDIYNYHIQIKTDIIHNDFSFMNIQLQTEFFSLLLNNSIDSCIASNQEHKLIIFKSKKIASKIVISLNYSFDISYSIKNDEIINKVKKIVNKYNGLITYNSENNLCELTIVFN